MSLRLIIEDDEGATTIVPLGKDAITIGRQQGNTIQLTEKNVSRRHARLFPESQTWVIEDLNSYNGVKVNDRSVEGRMNLREGDIVQIGDYHLAITEDVDKSTLNFDRQGAANDQPVSEPLLASSSADLPRLSPEEIHALQSGPQQITPPPQPALLDSGAIPASTYGGGAYQDSEPRRGAGMLIGFGIVVIGALGLGVFWLATTGNAPDTPVATSNGAPKTPMAAPDAAHGVVDTSPITATAEGGARAEADEAGADDLAVVPPVDDGSAGATDGSDEAVAPVADGAGEDDPAEDDEGAVEVVDEDPPPSKPRTSTKPRTKTNTKTTAKKDPKPPPAAPSGPSAEELLSEARMKNLRGQAADAYRLAKQAYDLKRSSQALSLMCNSACKLGEVAKAQAAHSKLRGSLRTDAEAFCAKRGITL